jgi:hypothetical protein
MGERGAGAFEERSCTWKKRTQRSTRCVRPAAGGRRGPRRSVFHRPDRGPWDRVYDEVFRTWLRAVGAAGRRASIAPAHRQAELRARCGRGRTGRAPAAGRPGSASGETIRGGSRDPDWTATARSTRRCGLSGSSRAPPAHGATIGLQEPHRRASALGAEIARARPRARRLRRVGIDARRPSRNREIGKHKEAERVCSPGVSRGDSQRGEIDGRAGGRSAGRRGSCLQTARRPRGSRRGNGGQGPGRA